MSDKIFLKMSLPFFKIAKKRKRFIVLAELIGGYVLDEKSIASDENSITSDELDENRGLEYDYYDEYLKQNISPHTELRAKTEINYLKLKNEFFISKLVVLKAYIICCLENQTSADDLFAVKLKQYKAEFEAVLALALQDKAQNGSTFLNAFNAPLLRG